MAGGSLIERAKKSPPNSIAPHSSAAPLELNRNLAVKIRQSRAKPVKRAKDGRQTGPGEIKLNGGQSEGLDSILCFASFAFFARQVPFRPASFRNTWGMIHLENHRTSFEF